jgi:hypothetical protein
MAGNINDFKSSFVKDLAKSSKFDVYIPVPIPLILYVNQVRNLNMRCEETHLPGRTLATADLKIGSSPVEKYPYATTFNDIDLTFMLDDSMNHKVFFDAWMNYISPDYTWNLRYKEDYATTITINQYDAQNKKSYSVDLYEAYPISMNQLDLSWGSEGYHKLNVTFAYTSWKNNSLQNLGNDLLDLVVAGGIDFLNTDFDRDLGSAIEKALDSAGLPIEDE